MIYQIAAILLLVFFYGVYLGKMLMQKHQGIKTDQIATKNKKGKVYAIELIMKIATYAIILVEIISIILNTHLFPQPVRITGIVIAVLGDVVFAISVYTMQDSWRAGIAKDDKTELVTSGIYSVSRNPAFLGFYLVYIGILMMFFHWILCVVTVFAITMLHLQVLQEEKHLADVFGNEYMTYKNKVKRYFTLLQNKGMES